MRPQATTSLYREMRVSRSAALPIASPTELQCVMMRSNISERSQCRFRMESDERNNLSRELAVANSRGVFLGNGTSDGWLYMIVQSLENRR